MKVKNKKTKAVKKVEKTLQNEITSSDTVKKGIIDAFKQMEKEDVEKSKTIINWIQSFINGLMLIFALTSFMFAWVFFQPIRNNIKNGEYFTIPNIVLCLDTISLVIFGGYTFKVNKYIDDVSSISDLTGICSFLLSVFATLIALFALMLQIEK